MTTESSPAHLPPFLFMRCKPFLQRSQDYQLPLFFLKAFPFPLFCMARCPFTLLPLVGKI